MGTLDPLPLLAQMLRAHDVATTERDGWLIPELGAPAWGVDFFKPEGVHDSIWRLDVSLALADGRLLVESCAGQGTDAEAAARNAFEKFSRSAFHVLLSAFCAHHDETQVHVEDWAGADSAWRALVGPVLWVGSSVGGRGMPEVLDVIRDAFLERTPLARPHWVRVYCARMGDGPMTLEILLDNVPWEVVRNKVAVLPWERSDGFQSFRLFAVVLPNDGTREATYLPEAESVRVGFGRLLEVVEADPESDDYSLFNALTAANVAPQVAERLIAFVPLAFGEVVLKEAHHSPEYQLHANGRSGCTYLLIDEPTYAIASRSAHVVMKAHGGAFRALALRSATMTAANQLLQKGGRLDDLHFTAAIVMLGRFSPPRAREPVGVTDSRVEPMPRTKATAKPWWRFW